MAVGQLGLRGQGQEVSVHFQNGVLDGGLGIQRGLQDKVGKGLVGVLGRPVAAVAVKDAEQAPQVVTDAAGELGGPEGNVLVLHRLALALHGKGAVPERGRHLSLYELF